VEYADEGLCDGSTNGLLYLKGRSAGQFRAAHFPRAADPLAGTPESDLHKAIKERTVRTAELAGFKADAEQQLQTPIGKYKPDVLVVGADGFKLACEAQVSYATNANVTKRTGRAGSIGTAPLWTNQNHSTGQLGHVPSQRI
jgi:competence CoiA-like predicted nuclease